MLRLQTIRFTRVHIAFVRICCAYGPLPSLKAIVPPPISLASSLWRWLKTRFTVQRSGEYKKGLGAMLDRYKYFVA